MLYDSDTVLDCHINQNHWQMDGGGWEN